MKKNKEKQELEITVENFMQDLKHYRRDNVRAMLNGGILQQIEEKDKMDVYRSILALCDRRIAEQLFKITGKFTVGMLELAKRKLIASVCLRLPVQWKIETCSSI